MIKNLLLTVTIGIHLCACSTPGYSPSYQKKPPAPEAPVAPKPPESPKKTVSYSRCKVSNGEGRIFHATDEVRVKAEIKARHECQIYSRHCTLLDCNETTNQDP